jgi:crotonyl-CoA carboxylase/reductase
MRTNRHKPGNMAVLVNASRPGLKNFDDALEAASLPTLNRETMRA